MSEKRSEKYDAVFPLSVSAFFSTLIIITVLIRLHLQTRLFLSDFDRISFYAFLAGIVLLCCLWLVMLVWDVSRQSFGRLYKPFKWLLFFVFYPLAWLASKLERVKIEKLQTSFLNFQNRLFLSSCKTGATSKILILLPHCLQHHDCKVRITRDIEDCQECGKCNISELKQLGKSHGIKIGIANGGTLARKIVHDSHPDVIIAVACHRDLTDGVRDSWKYPVYAILNERPNGPCYDTCVDVKQIEMILENTKHTN